MQALVIGSNPTLLLNVVQALSVANIQAEVLSDWRAPRVRFSRYCRRYHCVASRTLTLTFPGAADRLQRYSERLDIDLVIACDLTAIIGLAHLWQSTATAIPCFPIASLEVIETLHDKWRFHQLLRGLQLPSPSTHLLAADGCEAAHDLTYPLMLKPVAGEGSSGVVRCNSAQELLARRSSQAEDWIAAAASSSRA